jgi:hypothetical protein
MITCLCEQSVLDGTASTISITFNKSFEGDAVLWIREDIDTEEDELRPVDWSEARSVLPEPEQVDSIIAERPHSFVSFNRETNQWEP